MAEIVELVENNENVNNSDENNLTVFELNRFNRSYLAVYYDKVIKEPNNRFECFKDDNASDDLKIKRFYSSSDKIDLVNAVIDYYVSFLESTKNIFFEKHKGHISDYLMKIFCNEGKFNVVIKRDTALEKHKINARYDLCFGTDTDNFEEIFSCSLVESGNCCGSMTIYNFRREYNVFEPFTKLFISMIYDIAIILSTPNLIALNPTGYAYTPRLKELYGFQSVYSFKNINSGNNVDILVKSLPKEFSDEKIIIKF